MTKKIFLVILVSLFFNTNVMAQNANQHSPNEKDAQMTVYKSPTCGCCKGWIKHIEESGITTESQDVEDVTPYKMQYGVARDMASCHTAVIEGYFIEGHVPARDIKELLKLKPKGVVGLTVPRMPVGTPGMEMPDGRIDDYNVIAVKKDGTSYVFSSYKKGIRQ